MTIPRIPAGYRALKNGEIIEKGDVFYSIRSGELMRAQDLPESSAGSKWYDSTGRVPYYRIAKTKMGNIILDISL